MDWSDVEIWKIIAGIIAPAVAAIGSYVLYSKRPVNHILPGSLNDPNLRIKKIQ